MKQLTELRTQEEQEKYDIAIAWLEKFTNEYNEFSLKFRNDVANIMNKVKPQVSSDAKKFKTE